MVGTHRGLVLVAERIFPLTDAAGLASVNLRLALVKLQEVYLPNWFAVTGMYTVGLSLKIGSAGSG